MKLRWNRGLIGTLKIINEGVNVCQCSEKFNGFKGPFLGD